MADIKLILPSLQETSGDDDAAEEATVSFWYKNAGETVDKDEEILEMVTDKATFNVPSPVSGTIKEVKAEEGDCVEVGSVLAIIEEA